jgi:hypothetical protein
VGNKFKKSVLGGLAAVVVASSAFAASPAMADPAPSTYPPLAGTGSDTTQFVLDGLADVIPAIGSWDAIGSSLIQVTANGPQFNRPNGSGAGVRALTASINPTGTYTYPSGTGRVNITGQLDFARSSSGPSATGTQLTYIPFAQDAVSYAYSDLGDASVPANLTVGDLADIYAGDTTTYQDANNVTRTYVPILPQANSGTRAFFLSQIGLTESDVVGLPTVQENDGSQIDAIGELVPFSAGSYIAQSNGVVTDTVSDNAVVLGSVEGSNPITGTGTLNPAFPLDRLVYNVVQTSRLSGTSTEDVLLQDTFEGATSDVCEADEVIEEYGFAAISNCGATTLTGGYVAP